MIYNGAETLLSTNTCINEMEIYWKTTKNYPHENIGFDSIGTTDITLYRGLRCNNEIVLYKSVTRMMPIKCIAAMEANSHKASKKLWITMSRVKEAFVGVLDICLRRISEFRAILCHTSYRISTSYIGQRSRAVKHLWMFLKVGYMSKWGDTQIFGCRPIIGRLHSSGKY